MNKAATTIGIGMKMFRRGLFVYILALTGLIGGAPALAQLHGDGVLRTDTFNGDVFVSGGEVTIRATVTADVIAMGRNVTIRSDVSGDVVTSGGKVTVGDQIGGYVLAAAAGTVRAKGKINDGMTALGGKVEATGRIDGDVKRPAGGSKQKRNWAAI